MDYLIQGLGKALKIIVQLDSEFLAIVSISLKVSFTAIILAAVVGVPLGISLGLNRYKGEKIVSVILNSLLSLPTVLIGLLLYSFLSRQGPLGRFNLLFTPTAMIMGQFVLALPIITALIMNGIKNFGNNAMVAAYNLGAGRQQRLLLFIDETKYIISGSLLAGFGRIFAEVGVSMMVGGNIRFYTRNITTSIALEISKGDFGLGIALGFVLLMIAFLLSIFIFTFQRKR